MKEKMKKSIAFAGIFACCFTHGIDYKLALKDKKLVMFGAECAGISLKKDAGLSSEMGSSAESCPVDLKTRVKWLNTDTFMLVEKNKLNETSPPRVYIYQVISIVGNKVVLHDFWTGWNDYQDEKISYTIK
ncbi:hypothetical protein [Acinetobacter sp. HY1485]|uniref:hypothetical protein n=1 Tax=Acinetobacter sp. HY1485 TaxID=2970918 RepID=UPI0022B96734|nr:hypothetical protein [Acinetobacter sp. HY1485]